MDVKEILELIDLRIRDNASGVFAPESMNTLRAHIRELEARADNAEQAFVAAMKTMSDEARKRGEAEGRLEASELAGVVDGWKARAERAEAKVERLREALEFYAEPTGDFIPDFYSEMDFGETARAALAAMEATDE